jgi:hypothetical protein
VIRAWAGYLDWERHFTGIAGRSGYYSGREAGVSAAGRRGAPPASPAIEVHAMSANPQPPVDFYAPWCALSEYRKGEILAGVLHRLPPTAGPLPPLLAGFDRR